MSTTAPATTGPAQHGDKVRDLLTGFTGIMIGRSSWLHGCDRIIIQSDVLKDGSPLEPQSFDEQRVEIIAKHVLPNRSSDAMPFSLGSKVRDRLTGFTGILTGFHCWDSGYNSYTLEPDTLDEKGHIRKSCGVEAQRIELVQSKPIPVAVNAANTKTGGPQRGEDALPTSRQ